SNEPRLLDQNGTQKRLDLNAPTNEIPTDGTHLAVPQGDQRILILEAKEKPDGAKWRIRKEGNQWHVVLRLPSSPRNSNVKLGLNIWQPFRDDPGLVKELLMKK